MNNEMNARQNAKLNMYRTTEKHVDDNQSVVAANPAFQTAFNKFKTNTVAIQNVAQSKSASLAGVTADKSKARQVLCKLASVIAGAVSAYASANGTETLRQEMNLTVTALMRTRDEALAPRCQNIRDTAEKNLTALADFGIKPAQLAELQSAINNYSAETVKPRHAASTRKTANVNLIELFRENDEILKTQLDKLIELFRADYPDFVKTYFETRIILDPPTRTKKTEDASAAKNFNTN